ncbi:ATP-binding protein [Spirillospora sp. NPDC048911]|uniref:ATP-binding protein n=1 Tax=Spirillospora sp. NPDC048911 TaxID=3364527 RepID=UPI0037178189
MSTKWLGIDDMTGYDERDAVWELAAEAAAASRARTLTAETLRAWRVTDPADVDDIVLMVDELITNAIVHGTGPVRLRLHLDGPAIVGEITDDDPAVPGAPAAPPLLDWSEQGRGLLLVTALATGYGCRPAGRGKTVWFTRLLHTANGNGRAPT